MWIRTQNSQRIINSDQVIDIFIDKTGTKIYAETTCDGEAIELGTYDNRDTCLKVLDYITDAIECEWSSFKTPLGGKV